MPHNFKALAATGMPITAGELAADLKWIREYRACLLDSDSQFHVAWLMANGDIELEIPRPGKGSFKQYVSPETKLVLVPIGEGGESQCSG